MHPLGGICSLISTFLALFLSGPKRERRIWIAVFIIFFILVLALAVPYLFKKSIFFNPIGYLGHFQGIAQLTQNCLLTTTGALVQTVRLKDGLFGPFPLFCFVLCFGFFAAPKTQRKIAVGIILIYSVLLFCAFFHTDPTWSPGELFWRMCIPLVVILFGAVGKCSCFAIEKSLHILKTSLKNPDRKGEFSIQNIWPVLLLALVSGYSFDMVLSGSEQIYATREHMRNRQALNFNSEQPKILLSQAKPGDRVLYTSTMIMASYFIHGAMQQGAIYYHPAFRSQKFRNKWLKRKDLRFAAVYSPIVYHPSLEGLDENNRCITGPEFHFSPLNKPRKYGPISREGFIPAADFKWIQVKVKKADFPKYLRMFVRNPGKLSEVILVPLDSNKEMLWNCKTKTIIPSGWTGWVDLEIDKYVQTRQFRILLPKGQPRFLIGGIVFGKDKNHWPWAQKATLTFCAKNPDTGKVTLNFDPAKILPAPLKKRKITVLHDYGSSVLFRIDR
jgi:hypothetical protein